MKSQISEGKSLTREILAMPVVEANNALILGTTRDLIVSMDYDVVLGVIIESLKGEEFIIEIPDCDIDWQISAIITSRAALKTRPDFLKDHRNDTCDGLNLIGARIGTESGANPGRIDDLWVFKENSRFCYSLRASHPETDEQETISLRDHLSILWDPESRMAIIHGHNHQAEGITPEKRVNGG